MRKLVLLFVSALLIASACSKGSESNSSENIVIEGEQATEETLSGEDMEAVVLNFAQCARDNGFDVEDPTIDSNGRVNLRDILRNAGDEGNAQETRQAIMEKCGEILQEANFGGERRGDLDDAERQDELLQLAQCLRDEGIEVEDPNFDNFGSGTDGAPGQGGQRGIFGEGFDRDDPDTQQALETCRDSLGIEGGPGRRGPTQGGGNE